jgi:hypothetical protein
MEKANEATRCVHCLRVTDSETADHVFPDSWYPDTTPTTVQRWTVPSCLPCNKHLGQLERDLLIRYGLCLDPKLEATAGLGEKAMRALGFDVTDLSSRDEEHRKKLRARIKAELTPREEFADKPGSFVGIGDPDEVPGEWSIPIPYASLAMIGEKIVRGCEYKLKNRYVEPPYAVLTRLEKTAGVPEPFASVGRVFDFGPGCKIRRISVIEDPNMVCYWILIWDSLHLYVRVDLEVEVRKAIAQRRPLEGILPPESRRMRIAEYLRTMSEAETQRKGELENRNSSVEDVPVQADSEKK